MDKTNNLQYFLTDIADAIREKKGTSDLINAQNFADEIRNMPQSGGNAGGDTGSGMKYYDVSSIMTSSDFQNKYVVVQIAMMVRIAMDGKVMVVPGLAMLELGSDYLSYITAIATDSTERVIAPGVPGGDVTISDALSSIQTDITAITKEEFYNLNA